jgi:ATP-binding cassette subfamily B multidrug efflux pump
MFRGLESLIDPFRPYSGAPANTVWPFIRAHLKPAAPVLVASLVLALVGAGIEVWLIGYSGRLIDLLAASGPQQFWAQHGTGLIGAALIVLILRPLVGLREWLDDIAFRPNMETLIRWRTHSHVLDQSVGWFRQQLAGHVLTQVTAAGTAATGAIYSVVHTLSFVFFYVAGSLWLMLSIDPRLLAPLLIWIGLYFGLMAHVVPRYRRASEALQNAGSELTGVMVDSYANIETIKLMASRAEEDRQTTTLFQAMRQAFFSVQRAEVTINTGMLFLSSLLMVGLVGYGLVLWQSGAAPLGLVGVALALSFRITGMGEWLLDAVSSLFGHLGTLREALKTVAQPVTITDVASATSLTVIGGGIRFVDVGHHYGRDRDGLDGLTLTVAPCQKVGLIGRSGAGKSTMVNLILRYFDAEAGRIEIDGQDIRGVTQESLRAQIAMVSQDPSLLHRSVRDNIAFGRADVTQAMIEAAARQAAAHDFIMRLRDQAGRTGYDAHVGERGVTLSGGQRQRIALARAILKNAPILLLDEATSALDSEVEAAIQDTLYSVMEGKTVIAIAHRLSTIAHLDRIVVLDAGRIAEDGTHAELLALGGIYAGLWARQSGGFLADEAAA